jgi:hypothetical protein
MTDSTTQPDLSNLKHAGAEAAPVPAPVQATASPQAETPKTISEQFAEIGGIERHPARSFENQKPIDFSAAYGDTGKQIFPAPATLAKD